jgi:hypothetical protein
MSKIRKTLLEGQPLSEDMVFYALSIIIMTQKYKANDGA